MNCNLYVQMIYFLKDQIQIRDNIKYYYKKLIVYVVKFSNSWVIMSFLKKVLPKRLMKIAFQKELLGPNSYQQNTNLTVLTNQNSWTLPKSYFCQKDHVTKHPHSIFFSLPAIHLLLFLYLLMFIFFYFLFFFLGLGCHSQ